MLATAMVEANQCSIGEECPCDDEPKNIVSLLQTDVLQGAGNNEALATVHSQLSNGNADVPSSPRVAFLVRSHAPTAITTQRITQWLSSLQGSTDVDAFISIDRTDQTHANNVSFLLNALHSAGFNSSHIHQYNTTDILQEYPGLQGQGEYALRYVTAAVDVFLQTLPHTHKTYDHVWVLEDDVGYTGNISTLLAKYSGSADDLIAGSQEGALSGDKFPNVLEAYEASQTQLYREWVLPTQRVLAGNHVTRMSSRLLGRLNHWMKAGAFDLALVMPPTVCKMEDMRCSMLEGSDLGMHYSLGNGRVSQARYEQHQLDDSESGMPRLYHALKF